MEMQTESPQESVSGNSTPLETAVESVQSTPLESLAKPTPGQSVEVTQSPAYAPDFKFKASGKDHEIPAHFRTLVKDKKTEDEIKDIFSRAYGHEETKTRSESYRQQLSQVQPELQAFKKYAQSLQQDFGRGDFEGFFKKLNVPEEKVLQWVLDKINYNQLTPEQKADVDSRREAQQQAHLAQDQFSQATQRELSLATQVKEMQLGTSLGRPDVENMVKTFDSRVGKPGAFRDAIIAHGEAIWLRSKRDLSPDQVIEDFVKIYGNPAAFAQSQANPSGSPTLQSPQNPPVKVIPNIAGKSTSPLKSKPKSIEDLYKLRDEALAKDRASKQDSEGYVAH